jgi:hypothetical protein
MMVGSDSFLLCVSSSEDHSAAKSPKDIKTLQLPSHAHFTGLLRISQGRPGELIGKLAFYNGISDFFDLLRALKFAMVTRKISKYPNNADT